MARREAAWALRSSTGSGTFDMAEFDDRIVKVSVQVNGALKVYQSPLKIVATGTKYANSLQNDAQIEVFNLSKADRDFLLTETSPYNKNRTPKIIIVEAGRVSTGTSVIFKGNISSCAPTQPPDIGLKFKCLANQFLKGKIVSAQQGGSVPLSRIAGGVAGDLGVNLNFQAQDKNISNYAFTGGALKQLDELSSAGAVDVFIDGNQLVVKDIHVPLTGVLRILSDTSGMIGIPELTEQGVKVSCLLDNQTSIGGAIQIESALYPTINGKYVVYKLGFNITSRDVPFYWIPEGQRMSDAGGLVLPSGVKKHKGKKRR